MPSFVIFLSTVYPPQLMNPKKFWRKILSDIDSYLALRYSVRETAAHIKYSVCKIMICDNRSRVFRL